MDQPIIFVGLDVHKDTITVALADEGRRGDVREYGRIANTPADLKKLLDKLGCTGRTLRFCYEAGPCGYGIQRQLTAAGHVCVVVAPSLIPRKPGERIKTDQRDASNLARLHRVGELTSVWVPDPTHEAMRDLTRARLADGRWLPASIAPGAKASLPLDGVPPTVPASNTPAAICCRPPRTTSR